VQDGGAFDVADMPLPGLGVVGVVGVLGVAWVADACGDLPPDMMPHPEQATSSEIRQAASGRHRCALPWARP
jgi:hypothetical protein